MGLNRDMCMLWEEKFSFVGSWRNASCSENANGTVLCFSVKVKFESNTMPLTAKEYALFIFSFYFVPLGGATKEV